MLTLIMVTQCFSLDKDLVAYWMFDEGTGRIVKDMTGNGHDGKFVGDPKWVTGKFGKALEFDGSSNYVEVPDDPSLAIKKDITFTLWFKPSVTINPANNNYRMLSKNNDYFFLFNYEKLGQLGFLVKDPGGTNHVVHSVTAEWKKMNGIMPLEPLMEKSLESMSMGNLRINYRIVVKLEHLGLLFG